MKKAKLILAIFETRNFEFHVITETKQEALEALRKAWKIHAKQTEADSGYFDEYQDDVNYTEMTIGTVLKDLSWEVK